MDIGIAWLGTASVKMRFGSTTLLFDPYSEPFQKAAAGVTAADLEDLDAAFLTHPHFDHFAGAGKYLRLMNNPFYLGRRGLVTARHHHFPTENLREIAPGDVLTIGEARIRVRQGRHCAIDREQIGPVLHRVHTPGDACRLNRELIQMVTFPMKDEDIFSYDITAGGRRIFLMGSAGLCEEAEPPRGMDLLVLPYQGKVDMAPYALEIARYYEPKRIFLSHFDDAFPPMTCRMDTEAFTALMAKEMPACPVLTPEAGRFYAV